MYFFKKINFFCFNIVLTKKNNYGKNLQNEVIRQVKVLNELTVNYIIPDVITNIKQYYGYIKDISNPITPMIRPMSTNTNGRRALPSYTTMWK